MKIDFSQVILNIVTGKPLQAADPAATPVQGEPVPTKDLTLAHVAVESLLMFDQQSRESGDSKAKSYMLATRIVKGGVVDVGAEEIVLLKSKIGDAFAPSVVGAAYEMLELRVMGED